MKLPKPVREAVHAAVTVGFVLERGGKHWKLRRPDGRLATTIAHTPSDWRAERNIIGAIARARRELGL